MGASPRKVAVAVAVLAAGLAVMAGFFWLVIFFAEWFVPSKEVAWAAVPLAVAPCVYFLWRAPFFKRDRPLEKLAATLVGSFFLWSFLAGAVPALFTWFFGADRQVVTRVSAYYWSTGTCDYRIVLEDFGGFCRAGSSQGDFTHGRNVRVIFRQSTFGRYVLSIENER
ncbi:MAG TPA: hypothetical protein VLI06_07720 [Solimonas sp.]|nr:hypothetical protein [Solimonas sp.]